jgi:hypothetical protein
MKQESLPDSTPKHGVGDSAVDKSPRAYARGGTMNSIHVIGARRLGSTHTSPCYRFRLATHTIMRWPNKGKYGRYPRHL